MFGKQKTWCPQLYQNIEISERILSEMTVTKRTKIITVETWQRTVIRQTSRQTVWCEFCAANVEMITSEQVAIIFDISLDKIYQGIENGKLHFIEGENQTISICINSLKTYQ
jgi:hypothetical protein